MSGYCNCEGVRPPLQKLYEVLHLLDVLAEEKMITYQEYKLHKDKLLKEFYKKSEEKGSKL